MLLAKRTEQPRRIQCESVSVRLHSESSSPQPNSERTEAVAIEVSSPTLDSAPLAFPSGPVDQDAPPAVAAAGVAQQVTPWDVQGATVDGKQVRSSSD